MKNAYQTIREELKKRRENVKGFTAEFFKDFAEASTAADNAIITGTLEKYRYEKNGIIFYHLYDKVYNSDFYRNNSGAYCEFLSVYLDTCTTEYKFVFGIPGGQVTRRRHFANRDHAEKYAARIMEQNNYNSFEIVTA